jgi:hypothetical protein
MHFAPSKFNQKYKKIKKSLSVAGFPWPTDSTLLKKILQARLSPVCATIRQCSLPLPIPIQVSPSLTDL